MSDRVALGLQAYEVALTALRGRTVDRSAVQAMLAKCDGFDPDDDLVSAARGFGAVWPGLRLDADAMIFQGRLLKGAVERNCGSAAELRARADLDG